MAALDPVVLSAVHDLELVARVTVEGALSGLHRSPFHGYSAEFNQYRHYRPGDDLKYVDWKLFARTDRVYTKQFRETTNVRVQLVRRETNSRFYALIEAFARHTGVPVVLNTSFNLRGEPIVCSPWDAMKTFSWSDMDYLLAGNVLVWKEPYRCA